MINFSYLIFIHTQKRIINVFVSLSCFIRSFIYFPYEIVYLISLFLEKNKLYEFMGELYYYSIR